jgi:structural maintenance of chromosome 2
MGPFLFLHITSRGGKACAMFIEELIIDGFKSYASRTVISGWDKNFNAITVRTCRNASLTLKGMNGSGKSNILDAV